MINKKKCLMIMVFGLALIDLDLQGMGWLKQKLWNSNEQNLIDAITKLDKRKAEKIVKNKGVSPISIINNGQTLLHLVAAVVGPESRTVPDKEDSKAKLIEWLVKEHKLDANARDSHGNTPLHNAIQKQLDDFTKKPLIKREKLALNQSITKLIDLGADVDSKNNDDQTPFDLTNEAGNTLLELAAAKTSGRKVIERLLVNSKNPLVYIQAKNVKQSGNTLLHTAAAQGKNEAVGFLLNNGADANAVNYTQHAPLHLAAGFRGTPVTLNLLETKAAKLDARDKDGDTSLHVAIQSEIKGQTEENHVSRLEFIKALISAGADVNIPNKDGDTPLHLAAQLAEDDVLKALLKVVNIVVNSKNNDGNTPLHQAAFHHKDKHTIELLLKAGADATIENKNHETPINVAQTQEHFEIIPPLEKAVKPPLQLQSTPLEEVQMALEALKNKLMILVGSLAEIGEES